MVSEPRLPTVDVLVVGALTIDHFTDGSSAPGGSVLHATRVAAATGLSVAVVTQAASEPEARAGLSELAQLGVVHAERVRSSLAFTHAETNGVRRLTLDAPAAPFSCPARPLFPRVVLYGPVAAEYGAGLGGQVYDGAFRAAILQGWLRSLDPGAAIRALPLSSLGSVLVERLASFDLLVASEEDLSAVAAGAGEQLSAVRAVFGPHPILAVTGGARGAWLEEGDGTRVHLTPARVISGIPMTGAGDGFAAVMAASLSSGLDLEEAGARATAAAVSYLERRLEVS
jgi:sugar/nucleoside kinase (ribokinase family)